MNRSRLATLLSLAMVLTGCAAGAPASAVPALPAPSVSIPSPVPSDSEAPQGTAPSAVAAPSTTPAVAQSPAPIGEHSDSIAEIVVDGGVRVRSLPSVGDASIKYEPLLRRGDEVFVAGGPVAGDGYDWYLVQALIEGDHGPFGWVSFASRDGEPWIQDVADTECPSRSQWLGTVLDEVLLHCFDDSEIEFETDGAFSCFSSDPPVIEHDWLALNCDLLEGDACGTCGLRVAAEPAAGFDIPIGDHARWALRGHFDDPAATGCVGARGSEAAATDQEAVHRCRTTFVLTSLERIRDAAS
jgi:hypothetical protein